MSEFHPVVPGSVTRCVDLARPWTATPIARDGWQEGDVVVVEAHRPPIKAVVERADGRMAKLADGDHVVGALGSRAATLEAVGSWRDVGPDRRMHMMTSAGLLGRVTSISPHLTGYIVDCHYVGHVERDGRLVRLRGTVPEATGVHTDAPVVLLVGTSMSSGKTTAARAVVRLLKERGLRVVAVKLTGAGRYRDILSMQDEGADAVFDFVDVGLASTVVPATLYAQRLERLLELVAAASPDVVVAEAGASPLEPYNGETVLERLQHRVRCTVLCASDPYAVAGVITGFGRAADLVSGPAVNTSSGVALVRRLSGLPTCNVRDPDDLDVMARVLERTGVIPRDQTASRAAATKSRAR